MARFAEAVQGASNGPDETDAMEHRHDGGDLVQGSPAFGQLDLEASVRVDGHGASVELTLTLPAIHCLNEMETRFNKVGPDAAHTAVEVVADQYPARPARMRRPPANAGDLPVEIAEDLVTELTPPRHVHLKRPGEPTFSQFSRGVLS